MRFQRETSVFKFLRRRVKLPKRWALTYRQAVMMKLFASSHGGIAKQSRRNEWAEETCFPIKLVGYLNIERTNKPSVRLTQPRTHWTSLRALVLLTSGASSKRFSCCANSPKWLLSFGSHPRHKLFFVETQDVLYPSRNTSEFWRRHFSEQIATPK